MVARNGAWYGVLALLCDWSMSKNERTSPALPDRPLGGVPGTRVLAVLVLGLSGAAWLGWQQVRQQACEKYSQKGYQIASYGDRLALGEITGVPEGARHNRRDWTDIRPRLDDYEREWISLRTRACVEGHTALTRCLDHQAGKLAVRINAWVHGDPSWVTDDLDDAIPAPTRCLEGLGG